MSTAELLMLGAIAGGTIFLGLPVGRIRRMGEGLRAFLNAIAVGILVFLLAEVLTKAADGVETALDAAMNSKGSWSAVGGRGAVFALGLAVGLLSLVYYDSWLGRRAGGPSSPTTPTYQPPPPPGASRWSPAQHLALFIAAGIGLHNFAEGLAIGQSAATGEVTLAVLLVIGFALHNATEGFGIIAPLSGEPERPSWRFLALAGTIGGGPTFVGTLVGRTFVNKHWPSPS